MNSSVTDLLKIIMCPRCKQPLLNEGDFLLCPKAHRYRIVEGIPILLVSEAQQMHIEGDRTLLVAEGDLSHATLLTVILGSDEIVLPDIRRILKTGEEALVQLLNVFGVRCLYHEIRRGFRETRDFEVRYWTIPELKATFSRFIGPARVLVDGYFSLNAQVSDVEFLPRRYRAIVHTSEWLRRIRVHMPALGYISDSLYVSALRLDGVSPTP